MGYYLELRPRDLSALTVEEYKQRFLRAGLTAHSDVIPESEEERWQEAARNEVFFSEGFISIFRDLGYRDEKGEPTGEDMAPSGVSASARLSWGFTAQEVEQLVHELIAIADAVNADLILYKNQVIRRDTVHLVVENYLHGKKVAGSLFGFMQSDGVPDEGNEKTS